MRERGAERERVRDRESRAGSQLSAQSPKQLWNSPEVELELTNHGDHDLNRRPSLNRLSHPGAPNHKKVFTVENKRKVAGGAGGGGGLNG